MGPLRGGSRFRTSLMAGMGRKRTSSSQACSFALISFTSNSMREIVTQARLPFARDKVWSVLTDFGAYRDWNPLNVAANGVPENGARVRMTFIDPGHPG